MRKIKHKFIGKLALIALAFITAIGWLFISGAAYGKTETHGSVARNVVELNQKGVFTKEYRVLSVTQSNKAEALRVTVKNFTLMNVTAEAADIISTKPEYVKLIVPFDNGTNHFTLLLYRVNISPNGFTLLTSDGQLHATDNSIVHYRGIIENDDQSLVAVSFSSNEIMGMISNAKGNYVLGKIENDNENLYMIYNDKDMVEPFHFDCATNTSIPQGYNERNTPPSTLSTNCVNWYWETDYDIYVGKGSNVSNVNTYVQGIFNQVATLYANDGMNITLLTVFIWSTVDPYTGPSTSDFLTQFGTYRTSFNGNLATLLGYAGGGGVAWLNGFCASTSHKMGYCGISSSFNTVPTYSWTVEVVAHEEGHLFGSHHTHDCVWNGNNTKIDACGDNAGYPSGTCPLTNPVLPPGGGTIMSYCHLTSVGINFNLGFGPQPQALMLNNEETSSCLSACSGCNPPAQPATISGGATVCQGSVQTFSVTAVAGATSYTWTLPSGWTGSSTTTSIVTTVGISGGNVTVKANNACGSSAVRTKAETVTLLPASAGTITRTGGTDRVCPGDARTYTVATVTGITYNWTVPAGASISSGQGTHSINVTYTASFTSSGTITVSPSNSCGAGPSSSRAVNRKTPAKPGVITGPASACHGTIKTYSINSVNSATSYSWTVPAGASIQGVQNDTLINLLWGSNGGSVTVKSVNACGISAARSLSVSIPCREPGINDSGEMIAEAYPNPTDGKITVRVSSGKEAPYTITLTDITGRILVSENYSSIAGENSNTFDLSGYNKGIYFIRVENIYTNKTLKIGLQ
jgi:hypothetical protein